MAKGAKKRERTQAPVEAAPVLESDSDYFSGGDTTDTGSQHSSDGGMSNVQVDFDVLEMLESDVPAVDHLMKSYFPFDLSDEVSAGFATAMQRSPTSCVVKVAPDEEEEETEEEETDELEEIYGLTSLVSCRDSEFAPFLAALDNPVQVVSTGTGVKDLLGTKRALLLFSARVHNMPLMVASGVYENMFKEFFATDAARTTMHCVCVAKLLRVKSAPKGKKKDKDGKKSAKKEDAFNLDDYDFPREEEKLFYAVRDPRVAVAVYRFPKRYDDEPQHETPLGLSFAFKMSAIPTVLGQISSLAQKYLQDSMPQ